jgi:hypothetical protein
VSSKAVAEVAPVILCETCDKPLTPRTGAHCDACFDHAVEHDVEIGLAEIEDNKPPIGQELREWAARRYLFGHISKEVRAELEQCAEDIEVGHG